MPAPAAVYLHSSSVITTLELTPRGCQVACPCQDLHFGILVSGISLIGRQRHHVTLAVRPVVDVVAVEEECRSCRTFATNTAVKEDIRTHILQGRKAAITNAGVGKALIALKACNVSSPDRVITQDQVRHVRAARAG